MAIGVDSHKASLAAAAVDPLGRVIVAQEFPNSPEGHEALPSVGAATPPRPSDRDRVLA